MGNYGSTTLEIYDTTIRLMGTEFPQIEGVVKDKTTEGPFILTPGTQQYLITTSGGGTLVPVPYTVTVINSGDSTQTQTLISPIPNDSGFNVQAINLIIYNYRSVNVTVKVQSFNPQTIAPGTFGSYLVFVSSN
jgi:hypothetical protein